MFQRRSGRAHASRRVQPLTAAAREEARFSSFACTSAQVEAGIFDHLHSLSTRSQGSINVAKTSAIICPLFTTRRNHGEKLRVVKHVQRGQNLATVSQPKPTRKPRSIPWKTSCSVVPMGVHGDEGSGDETYHIFEVVTADIVAQHTRFRCRDTGFVQIGR